MHYLQWAIEMGPEKLMAIAEERSGSRNQRNQIALSLYEVVEADNGLFTVTGIKPSVISNQFLSSAATSKLDRLAESILYEACAEFFRCYLDDKKTGVDYNFIKSWAEKDFTFKLGAKGPYDNVVDLYNKFLVEGLSKTLDELIQFNGHTDLEDFSKRFARNDFSIFIGASDIYGLVYFFGHILGQDLFAKVKCEQDFLKISRCFFPGHENQSSALTRVDTLIDFCS